MIGAGAQRQGLLVASRIANGEVRVAEVVVSSCVFVVGMELEDDARLVDDLFAAVAVASPAGRIVSTPCRSGADRLQVPAYANLTPIFQYILTYGSESPKPVLSLSGTLAE